MRSWLDVVGAFVTLAMLAGAAPAATTPQLKVALIAPSARNDLAYTQSMFAALAALRAKYHIALSVSENQFVVDDARLRRQYAAEGYGLIVAPARSTATRSASSLASTRGTRSRGEPRRRRSASPTSMPTRPPPTRAATCRATSPRS